MTMDYTKVVLEGDARGRASIGARDADGAGHGYRLAGPKYIEDITYGRTTPKTFTVELGAEDVDELHSYLRIWDEINLGGQPPEWASLVLASDRYRQAVNKVATCRGYPNFPVGRMKEIEGELVQARRRLAVAALDLAVVLDTPVEVGALGVTIHTGTAIGRQEAGRRSQPQDTEEGNVNKRQVEPMHVRGARSVSEPRPVDGSHGDAQRVGAPRAGHESRPRPIHPVGDHPRWE